MSNIDTRICPVCEIEIHRTNAERHAHKIVHQWRAVIDYSEKDVWEVLKRHKVNPHPCYHIGWNRCSCAMCVFSTPLLFAGIRKIYLEEYEVLKRMDDWCYLMGGSCFGLFLPSFCYTHTEEEIKRITDEKLDKLRAMRDKFIAEHDIVPQEQRQKEVE